MGLWPTLLPVPGPKGGAACCQRSPLDAVKSMATVKLIWVLGGRKTLLRMGRWRRSSIALHAGDAPQPTGPTLGAPPGPPSPAAPLHGREHRGSPAPDVVQERVVRLHSEGQQGHLWGQQGEQDGSHAPCPVPTQPSPSPSSGTSSSSSSSGGSPPVGRERMQGAARWSTQRCGGGLSHPWVIPGGAAWSPWGL